MDNILYVYLQYKNAAGELTIELEKLSSSCVWNERHEISPGAIREQLMGAHAGSKVSPQFTSLCYFGSRWHGCRASVHASHVGSTIWRHP